MKKNERINAFLAIEVQSTECFFQTHKEMKSDSVALSIHQTAKELQNNGFQKAIFYIDQNPTHKNLMKYNLALLDKLQIEICIRYIPKYSPKLNVVEFLIHLIRQKKLHHATHKRVLKDIIIELKEFLNLKKTFSEDTIYNIFDHIFKIKNKDIIST